MQWTRLTWWCRAGLARDDTLDCVYGGGNGGGVPRLCGGGYITLGLTISIPITITITIMSLHEMLPMTQSDQVKLNLFFELIYTTNKFYSIGSLGSQVE